MNQTLAPPGLRICDKRELQIDGQTMDGTPCIIKLGDRDKREPMIHFVSRWWGQKALSDWGCERENNFGS